jgi:hypothetical protein
MKNLLIMAGGIVIFAALGYVYYYFVGCRTGTCPLTASPYSSILMGAVFGAAVGNLFRHRSNSDADL